MAINKVDYEVLRRGASTYNTQAQAINEVLRACKTMNDQLAGGWTNETATAFIERFDREYSPALRKTVEALESISAFITSYATNRQQDDAASARQISSC